MKRLSHLTNNYFALWVILFSLIAYAEPSIFTGIKPYISILLGIIMLGMGMTLKLEDFKAALKTPRPILIGVSAQFLIMPLVGFLIASIFNFPNEIKAGFVLLGACPGGTASNVLVYLARGNVPLSIAMTSISTTLSPIATPFFLLVLAKKWLPINPLDLFLSIVQIIIIPITLGILINTYFPRFSNKSKDITPSISVIAIIAIVACVIALNKTVIQSCGGQIFICSLLHSILGLSLGFTVSKILKQTESTNRAICLEVGTQNAGLGTALAYNHFTSVTALPCVMFVPIALINGAILSSFWSRNRR